jgi:cytidyltransferase-like protein
MMKNIDFRLSLSPTLPIHSLCGVLGSFDPLHKGHEWIVEQLLNRFDAVVLLIPGFHFEKTVRFPLNATFEQRLSMLSSFAKQHRSRIVVGLAHEVLFLQLANCLANHFPSVEISFGMGNETFERFLASKTYYDRLGIPWTEQEQAQLDHFRETFVVFGRSGAHPRFIEVPEHLCHISSTRVRNTVIKLRESSAAEFIWQTQLKGLISEETREFIYQEGIYASLEFPLQRVFPPEGGTPNF